jgi:hypothetical protein
VLATANSVTCYKTGYSEPLDLTARANICILWYAGAGAEPLNRQRAREGQS